MEAQFSILIAHYNNSNYFLDCFKSINEQTVQNFEVVIVDDFSSGEEFIKICKLIENDKRFKIYRNEFNKGVGYTKRRLVELASCEICGFLDPDDTLVNSALEIMLKKHLEYPNASLINSNLNFCNDNLDIIKESEIE